jgi:protocatechuate 3,4-dioxygenase beta subunit
MLLVLALAALLAPSASGQRKKSEDQNVRSVEGVVEDPLGNPVEGAVVQLKNAKTLQVRSFITQREGNYYFHGLSPDVEYELKAEFKNMSSPVRRLTVFDNRRKAIINLKLESQQ